MASKPVAPGPALPEATAKSGATCSLACNLPHGLLVVHAGRKLTIAGANHPKAIKTGLAFSATWGITHNVDEAWYDDWVKNCPHPAVTNGLIVKNTSTKIVDHAEALADGVATGTDQLEPDAKGNGVETKDEED